MIRRAAVSAAGLLALLLLGGCTDDCLRQGCPEGLVCSLQRDRCLEPGEVYGPTCLFPEDCHREICLRVGDSQPSICTATCNAGDPACPAGFACAVVGDGLGGSLDVCVPAGSGVTGAACLGGEDCASGLCLPVTDQSVCTAVCDVGDPRSCGPGNVACGVFVDDLGTQYGFCLAGGEGLPGQSCPGGLSECDLSMSDACLSNADGSLTLCAAECPGGTSDCAALPGACCADLGEAGAPAPYCLPAIYCPCEPACLGRICGDDGCGGVCGTCEAGQACDDGLCSSCAPQCEGLTCGPDGCGGVCGTCAQGAVCQDGVCAATCTPQCTDRACGPDGCGGLCGTCDAALRCHAGACVDPGLLLVEALVLDRALDPPTLWGLGEYQSAPSIGPPVAYGAGPQPGTTQELLCGVHVICSEVVALSQGTPYELVLAYGPERTRCTAFFMLESGAAVVDGGTCLVDGGGPFATVEVSGNAAPTFSWTAP